MFLLLLVLLCLHVLFNPFSIIIAISYYLKTLENLQFSDVFKEYRSGTLIESYLTHILLEICFSKLACCLWFIFRAFVLIQRFFLCFKFHAFRFFFFFSLCVILIGFYFFREFISLVAYFFLPSLCSTCYSLPNSVVKHNIVTPYDNGFTRWTQGNCWKLQFVFTIKRLKRSEVAKYCAEAIYFFPNFFHPMHNKLESEAVTRGVL